MCDLGLRQPAAAFLQASQLAAIRSRLAPGKRQQAAAVHGFHAQLFFDNIPVSLYDLPMKTTIDFPEHILHRAKTIAVQRKISLKELVIQGLEHAMRQPVADPDAERRARAASLIASLSRGKNTEPVGPLNRDEIYDRQQGKWD